jgi:hypothetical protein
MSAATLSAVFFTSLSVLTFEILLLRVFSIVLWYHFAFMVVSISMLGFAASGTVLAALKGRRGAVPPLRSWYFLALGSSMVFSSFAVLKIPFDPVRLSWDWTQLLHISLYYLVLALPFFAAGFIVGTAFATRPASAGNIYAADLAGAAAGTVLVFLLQSLMAPGQAAVTAAALAMTGTLLMGNARMKTLAAGAMLLCAGAALWKPLALRVNPSPYKELPSLLRMQGAGTLGDLDSPFGRITLFESPGVRHAPGLSLRYRGELPRQLGLSVDGSSVTTVSLSGEESDLAYLDHLPSALPFVMKAGGDVLLLDAPGSHRPLMAQRNAARTIDCTVSNPAVFLLLEREGILGADSCSPPWLQGLGRNLLRRKSRSYDLIDLTLTGTLPAAAGQGGGEDYRLTVEAFKIYLGSLREEGILSVSIYLAPPYRAELRLFTTLLEALEEMGAEDPGAHVMAQRSLGMLTFITGKEPFGEEEISTMRNFAAARWFDPVFFRGMKPAAEKTHIRTRGSDLAEAFSLLADAEDSSRFLPDYPFDISPVRDDSPFFHNSLKLGKLREVFDLVQGKWEFFIMEGYLPPVMLVQVLFLGLLFVILPAGFSRRKAAGPRADLVYFSFLGAGYMLVEVGAMHYLVLLLEHPVASVSIVLFSLLLTSGIGSWISRDMEPRHLWKAALAAGILALSYALLGRTLPGVLYAAPLPVRAGTVFVLLSPAGLLMGMLFPGGIRYLAAGKEDLIPWAWAVNGFFSVVAPVAAVLVAAGSGFTLVFVVGAVSYLGASLSGRRFCALPTMGTNRTPPS